MDVLVTWFREGGAWMVAGMVLKGTALLMVAFGVTACLRRASAALRHLVWSAAIAGILALPLVSAAVPWRIGVLPVPAVRTSSVETSADGSAARNAAAHSSGAARPAGAASRIDPSLARGAAPRSAISSTPARRISAATADGEDPGAGGTLRSSGERLGSVESTPPIDRSGERDGIPWLPLLAGLWALGAVAVLARLVAGVWVVRGIVERARPLESSDWTRPFYETADRLGLARAPALLMSDRLPMPFVCGLVRRSVVLPRSASDWDDRRRRAVLLHELAHVRRLDLVMNVLGRIACALYWFHPLVWMAARRLRAESERAADDMVLTTGTRASEYADHLLRIVCRAGRSATPAVAVPMAQRREFEGRMLAILEAGARRHGPSRSHAAALAGLALGAIVPVAALGPAAPGPVRPAPADSIAATAEPARPTTRRPDAGTASAAERKAGPDARARDSARASRGDLPVTGRSPEHTRTSTTFHESMRESSHKSSSSTTSTHTSAGSGTPGAAVVGWLGDALRQALHASAPRPDSAEASVVTALIHVLDDSSADVRMNAAWALGEREATSAVPALAARLRSDDSPRVREMCAWALGEIQSKDATSALADAARRDPVTRVRVTAVWALGEIEDPGAVTALASALSDSSADVRGSAAWALGSIEPASAPAALVHALGDLSATVRLRAAWALGQIEDTAAAPSLGSLLADSAADVRHAAVWALGRLDSDRARGLLVRGLDSRDPDVRARAVRALAGAHSSPWPWPWPQPRPR